MMENLLILATEAHAEAEGFGFNFDILETNLINLAILIGILVYYAPKTLGKTLSERRTQIAEEIAEAEEKQQKAAATLAEEQQKLAQAQKEAESIVKSAEERAKTVKAEIAAKATEDIERMRETAAKDLSAETDRTMLELRRRVSAMALERAENKLVSQLDDSGKQSLIDRSLAQLGGQR